MTKVTGSLCAVAMSGDQLGGFADLFIAIEGRVQRCAVADWMSIAVMSKRLISAAQTGLGPRSEVTWKCYPLNRRWPRRDQCSERLAPIEKNRCR